MTLIQLDSLETKIFLVRGLRIMIDRDLALLYGVSTKALNQAVRRNIERFPIDFMFQLSFKEAAAIYTSRSQTVTLNRGSNCSLTLIFPSHPANESPAGQRIAGLFFIAAVRHVFNLEVGLPMHSCIRQAHIPDDARTDLGAGVVVTGET